MFRSLRHSRVGGLSEVIATMFDDLTNEDWERIVFALSHFGHNPEFRGTLTKIRDVLKRR